MIPLYFCGQLLTKQCIAMDQKGLQKMQPVSIIVQMSLPLVSSESINKSLNSSEPQYFYL